jgi:hypothetical protein
MRKVVEWQGLRRGERIFVVSAGENGRNKLRVFVVIPAARTVLVTLAVEKRDMVFVFNMKSGLWGLAHGFIENID